MKLAIITTVYNRKEKTRKAIESIVSALDGMELEYKFYICDDGSNDGTAEYLYSFGDVISVIKGSGDLFWSRGMYQAMNLAVKDRSDLYLMINDDVEFFPTVIKVMLESYYQAKTHCGIVGSTKGLITDKITYGGRRVSNKALIYPNGELQSCELTNWNCFLIDHYVAENVGLIDNFYEHALGDFDYSLRMNKQRIPVYVAVDYIGRCDTNSKSGTYHDKKVPRKKRFAAMISRRNMPIKSRWHYYIKNFGIKGIKDFIWPYIKCSAYILLGKDY